MHSQPIPKSNSLNRKPLHRQFLGLAMALAAAGAAFIQPAHTQPALTQPALTQPALVADERGDLALAPYYTVRGDWVTGLHIVNTSPRTQVVKVRLRRATDGMNALDFNLVMPPEDVYAGFLSDDENGAIAWASPDATCTVPATQGRRLAMPEAYKAGAETGYIEIIAMGRPTAETLPIARAARHDATTSAPLDCQAVRSNFFADGAGTAVGATTRNGVENQSTTWQAASMAAGIEAGGRNTYVDSGNVLKVSYFLRDNATGIEFGDNAVHIRDFLDTPAITNQQYSVLLGDLNGFDFPDLNGGVPLSSSTGSSLGSAPIQRGRFDRLRANRVLGVSRIVNEWSANPANGVAMNWVVTLPGQYTMLNLPQYMAALTGVGRPAPGVDAAGNLTPPATCPREAIPARAGAAAVAECDYRDLPVELAFTAYNREERSNRVAPTPELVVSPGLPGATPRTYLPKVANVIAFSGEGDTSSSALGPVDARVTADLGQPYGWLSARVSSRDADIKVCDWDFARDIGAGFGAAAGAALKDAMVCTPVTGAAVPVIGFAAWSRRVAANPEASYGRIVEHSYERARAPASGLSLKAGDAQVTVAWAAVSGARSYNLYYSPSPLAGVLNFKNSGKGSGVPRVAHIPGAPEPSSRALSKVTVTDLTRSGIALKKATNVTSPHTVTGLSNGAAYYFVLTFIDADGVERSASPPTSATPRVPAPSAPGGLALTAGNARVAASWTAVSGATGYTLYYSEASISDITASGVRSVNVTGASATASGLTNGRPYYFVVTARNAGGESAASTEASATPQAPAPGAPTDLRLTAGNAQVVASWTAVSGATGYTLYYSEASISDITASGVNSVRATGATATVTGLTNGTLYYFVVTAGNAGGESAASTEASATPQAPVTAPAAPTNLSLTAGNRQVTANWTAVTGATSYTLYYATSSLASTTDFTGVSSVTASGTSATATDLINGTQYYFVVTATNAGGESVASLEATATPQLPAPTGLTLVKGNAEVAAVWAAVPNATGYTLYYSTLSLASTTDFSGVESVSVTDGSTITALVTGLTNGTLYYFRVIATSAGHRGAASPEASAAPRLPAPVGLTLTPGNAEVAASWLSVPRATGYKLYYSTASLASTTDFSGIDSVSVSGGSTTSAATVTGLINGTRYYFVVTATSAGGESAASLEASATPQAPVPTSAPDAPTGLALTAGYEQLQATWTAVSGATAYNLYYSESSLAGVTNLNVASITKVENVTSPRTVTKLTNGTLYYVVVTARNAIGESAASAEMSTTPTLMDGSVFSDTLTVTDADNNRVEGPEMVVLPRGSFRMGSPSTEAGRRIDEGPVRTVTLNNRIAMGRYEVSFADYDRFVAAQSGTRNPGDSGWGRGTRPVIDVNQTEAKAYAAWLSTQTGKAYRLPSEAEWEYAARAGTTTAYSFGDSIACEQANYSRLAGRSCNTGLNANLARTVAGGRFAANVFGLYDMHGNVWERVEDCYVDTYSGAPSDGRARTSGCGATVRAVARGGSWLNLPRDLRSATRLRATPSDRGNSLGFRLVQDLNPAPADLSLAVGNGELTATWTAVSGATTYNLYYSTESLDGLSAEQRTTPPASRTAAIVKLPNLTGASHTITGLTNDTTYYAVVTANTAVGESVASTEASAIPQAPVPTSAPSAPTGLSLTAGNAQMEASWTAVSGATGYTLYYSFVGSLAEVTDFSTTTRTDITTVENVTSPHAITGLTNGRIYYVVVTANNAVGESAASSEASATPASPPAAPLGLSLTAAGNERLEAFWLEVDRAASYTLYYSTRDLAEVTDFSATTRTDITTVGNVTSPHAITGLSNGTRYYAVVTASNASGESAPSSQASATPQAPVTVPAPDAPGGLSLTAGYAQLQAAWKDVSGATSYTLYYSTTSLPANVTDLSSSQLSSAGITKVEKVTSPHDVLKLTNGIRYTVVVTASNAIEESAASSEASATPTLVDGSIFSDTLTVKDAGNPVEGPEMVVLPKGSFSMGSPAGESGRTSDEGPERTVTLSKRIAMGRYEVTFADYDRFVAAQGGTRQPGDGGWGRGTRPVIDVKRNEAQAYATWLSEQTGKAYRLPSEAEWEYAARANANPKTAYSFGATIACAQANYANSADASDEAVLRACNTGADAASRSAQARTVAVGNFEANDFKLHDMHGNVLEWTADCYVNTYTGAPSDGGARASGCDASGNGVLRGGSWADAASDLRSAARFQRPPALRIDGAPIASSNIGFRLVQDLNPAPVGLRLTAGNAQLKATWTAVSGAASYTLYYSKKSFAGVTDLSGSGITKVEKLTATSTTVTGLTNGTPYYAVVTARTALGESVASTPASATPQASTVSISGRLTFDLAPVTDSGLEYSKIRKAPIRGVLVDALDASGTVLASTRSDSSGDYNFRVAINTEVRIRAKAHMRQTEAGGPRWDVKVTDNTNGNALYTLQGKLASSGASASIRNLNAASGWVVASGGGSYAKARAAGPFAILSFTYDALQAFAAVDPAMNLSALEYRWSPRNRSASPENLTDGAIGGSFYSPAQRLIYLLGKENENTDEYDRSVVMHEFAHHFQSVMSRDDSVGGRWLGFLRLDMRLAFSEGFADTLGAMITNDPRSRNTYGQRQRLVTLRDMETNPVNPTWDANRIGWYHSRSVAAILYDLYDAVDTDDSDPLSLGLAPIYNTLTSDGFKNNRYYTSIYTFANQLLQQVTVPNRTVTKSRLDALLRRHNIFGRGDNGAGETNRGGLPETARLLPVYKSLSTRNSPVTLCSVDDAGVFNRLGNRAFVEVSFAENGAHTLSLTTSGSTSALPFFILRPYRGVTATNCTRDWKIDTPASATKTCTFTGNFQASDAAVMEAFDFQNLGAQGTESGDRCFTLSVVKNP